MTPMSIPKLIHQTAKTADLDARCRRYQADVQRLHPGWAYKLWTDADNDAFVRAEYPAFYPIFAGYPKPIMRADVVRYLLMDRLGGMYLDTDYEMRRTFDLTGHGTVIPWEADNDPGQLNGRLGNAFFAAAPGHLFFRRVIETLQSRGPVSADSDVLTTTGPGFLTSVYRALSPAEQAEVCTPERRLFNPEKPRSPREYNSTIATPGLYGVHHCFGTWVEFSLWGNLRNRASKLYRRYT